MKVNYINKSDESWAKELIDSMTESDRNWFLNVHNIHPFVFGDLVFDLYYKNSLHEGLITTYPFDKVKKSILKLLDLPEDFIRIREDEQYKPEITILVPNNKKEDCIKIFNLCGYYLSQEHDLEYFGDLVWILYFHAKYKNNDIVDVKQWPAIYHVAPETVFHKIMKNGLVPRAQDSNFFKYPDSIYCFKGHVTYSQIKFLAKQLYDYKLNNDDNAGNRYVVLKINTSMLKDSMVFYGDPDYSEGIYTYENIPPTAITKILTYNF